MKHTYYFEIFKANGKHVKKDCSVSTKLLMSENEAFLYCQQYAIDNQLNVDQVSFVSRETGRYLHKSSCLLNCEEIDSFILERLF